MLVCISALLLTGFAGAFDTSALESKGPKQAGAIIQNAEVQRKLFSRLEKLWAEHDAQSGEPTEESGNVAGAADTGMVKYDESELPETQPLLAAPAGQQDLASDESGAPEFMPTRENTNIGVFEDEEFAMCGHTRFQASLTGIQSDAKTILITSRDRTIPDIPFRGFEARLALESKTDLWRGCSVIAGYVEVSGIVRIGLSVRETEIAR